MVNPTWIFIILGFFIVGFLFVLGAIAYSRTKVHEAEKKVGKAERPS